jgi:scyllo-inositol 2-dehydrogenase (NADP+)
MLMINVGLVGVGKMGLSHLAILNTSPLVKSVAVCDTFSYSRSVIEKYTNFTTYADYSSLLKMKDLNAVLIATPTGHHANMVREALNKKLHIFCEKPLCLDAAESTSLTELAKDMGVVNQVGYHYRFVATFQEAKRLIDAGVLGKIHHVRVEAYGPVVLRPKGSTWRTSSAQGGGCLYDYTCHAVDLVNYLVGPPTSVSGTVLNKVFSRDVEDEVYATLHFDGGVSGQIAVNWSDESFRRMSTQVSVWGTNGRIIVDRQEIKTYIRNTEAGSTSLKPGWSAHNITEFESDTKFYLRGEEYSAQIEHFLKCIVEGRNENISSFSSAAQVDRVIALMINDADHSQRPEIANHNALSAPQSYAARLWRRFNLL